GIAIILVVYRHVLLGIEYSHIAVPPILESANMVFFSFRMPLFFILSGIFISGSMGKRTVKQLIGIKFENLLYPYLIWVFIQVSLQIVLAGSGSTNSHRGWIDYTYILYHPRQLDQFWYLPALFNCSVVCLLVKSRLRPGRWTHLAIGLGLYLLSPYLDQVSMMSDWMRFYIFFALGDSISKGFFKESSQRLLKSPWSLVGIIPFFILAQVLYLSQKESFYTEALAGRMEFLAIALTGCLSMVILAFRLQSWNVLSFLRVFGYHSLYIYVMHVMVAAGMRALLTHGLHIYQPVVLLVMGIVFAATIPVIFYNLLIENNIFWFLFTYRKHKQKSGPPPPQQKKPTSIEYVYTPNQ
ncbi:MAG: acyltransferase, partial [Bacteroidota bacterium]|nr:acyltransferase [Bacteroidota bacterium]